MERPTAERINAISSTIVPDMREQLGDLDAGFSVLLELVRTAHDGPRESLLHLNVAFTGQRLAMIFVQRGLRVERVQVADTAAHEERNDILGPRLEMRLLGRKRTMSRRARSRSLTPPAGRPD